MELDKKKINKVTDQIVKRMKRKKLAERVSIPAERYFNFTKEYRELMGLITGMFMRGDYVQYIAKSALDDEELKIKSPVELANRDPGKATKELRKNRQTLLQMFYVRVVSNFEIYLIELIKEVLKVKPEILSGTLIESSIKEMLEINSIETLIDNQIEKKVNSLSYKGFDELSDWCKDRGIEIVIPEEYWEIVVDAILTRNVIVHNRGIADKKYISSTTNKKFSEIGEQRTIYIDEYLMIEYVLDYIVYLTDIGIIKKYEIEAKTPLDNEERKE